MVVARRRGNQALRVICSRCGSCLRNAKGLDGAGPIRGGEREGGREREREKRERGGGEREKREGGGERGERETKRQNNVKKR